MQQHDVFGRRGALVGAQRLARRRVDGRQRPVEAQRNVDRIPRGHQPPREVRGPALEWVHVRVPVAHVALPENGPVEGIPREEQPVRGELNRRPRALVHDVEDPVPGGHQRAHAGHAVMVSRPARAAHPLQLPGRRDHGVGRDRVTVRPVQEVGPLVDLLGPRLDGLRPLAAPLHIRHALRRQHPEHLPPRQPCRILRHQQRHQVIPIREPLPRPLLRGHPTVEAGVLDGLPRPCQVLGISLEPMHEVGCALPEGCGERSVAAIDVRHQTTRDPGLLQYLPRQPAGILRHRRSHQHCRCNEPHRRGSNLHGSPPFPAIEAVNPVRLGGLFSS